VSEEKGSCLLFFKEKGIDFSMYFETESQFQHIPLYTTMKNIQISTYVLKYTIQLTVTQSYANGKET